MTVPCSFKKMGVRQKICTLTMVHYNDSVIEHWGEYCETCLCKPSAL